MLSAASKSRNRHVLYVAYPLLTVSEESAGGAEQMLWTLEYEMARRSLHTTVAASSGSGVSGEIFITGKPCTLADDFERRNHEHQDRILELVHSRGRQDRPFDLIHDKSGSFWPRATEIDVPVLATLHLPRHFYSPQFFANVPGHVSFNCVSQSQAQSFADLSPAVVPNGILLERFKPHFGGRNGLLWLGRVCQEKAPHLALEIAARASQPIILAGQVYPFSYHQAYFEREVLPRLSQLPEAVFIASPTAEQKRRLLREVQAVLITSLVEETSSLVAMEAAASGTPAIAFRRGALPEIVQNGVTGFLVDGIEEAAEALKGIERIAPSQCAMHAQASFSSSKMAEGYEQLYHAIATRESSCLSAVCGAPSANQNVGDAVQHQNRNSD